MEALTNKLMIDFETLDTEATGVILSAGLVVFNEIEVLEEWYWQFHVGGQVAEGRTVDPETVLWWAQTNPEEFQRLCTGGGDKLDDMRIVFKAIMKDYDIREIWSRGSMDFLMIEDIMQDDAPGFWMARDVRTLDSLKLAEMDTNAHHALEDAKNQVIYVQEILCQIKKLTSAQSAAQLSASAVSAPDVTGTMKRTQ